MQRSGWGWSMAWQHGQPVHSWSVGGHAQRRAAEQELPFVACCVCVPAMPELLAVGVPLP